MSLRLVSIFTNLCTLFGLVLAANIPKDDSLNPRCLLEGSSGPCRGYFRRYHFDPNTKTCKSFGWGGCLGTVPFKTSQSCKDLCINKKEFTTFKDSSQLNEDQLLVQYVSRKKIIEGKY